jgi:hypothetical protein
VAPAANGCVLAWGCLRVWYTYYTVIRGFVGTLLLVMGLWGSFHAALLVKGTAASCKSSCTCGCCMHGGTCSMMPERARMRMAPQSGNASGASRTRPDVACSCSVSQPVTSLMSASHADMLFNLPGSKLFFVLPSAFNRGARNSAIRSVADGRPPDPPPRTSSS